MFGRHRLPTTATAAGSSFGTELPDQQLGAISPSLIRFYHLQLHRHPEAAAYLAQRGVRQQEVIEQMRIGSAPGRCLRVWLMSLNATQMRQLCDGAARTVCLAFDCDANGSGQRAAFQLAPRLWAHRVEAFPVSCLMATIATA